MAFTGKQRRALRALGHHLKPVIHLGKEGLSPTVVAAVDQALEDHELIKLKIGEACPTDRYEAADQLAAKTKAEVAQVLGRTALLFRRRKKDPEIVIPGLPLPKVDLAAAEEAKKVKARLASRPKKVKRPSRRSND